MSASLVGSEMCIRDSSSASPELKAMVFWVVDQCLMACCPRARTPLHVDLSLIHILTLPTICSV
eukprot:6746327-Alexandrium_andersonii.AAC.1